MSDLKLKEVEGLNGNTVRALEAAGVVTMADYMRLDNAELLKIKGLGVTSVTAMANHLQPQIQQFREEAKLDVPGHPDETVLEIEEEEARESLVTMTEETMVLPEPTALDEHWEAEGEPVDLVPQPLAPEFSQPVESRTESQEEKEIFQQDQRPKQVTQEAKVEQPIGQEFIIDLNPALFRNHGEAVSFLCDYMIATQPRIVVPNQEHSMEKAFVTRWQEHMKRA